MQNKESKQFVIIGLGNRNNAIKEMFYEVIEGKVSNAIYVEPFKFPNKAFAFFNRVIFSKKLRKYFRWIPKNLWARYHILNNISFDKNKQNYIIFTYGTDIERLHFSSIIKDLKKRLGDSVKTVLMLFDPLSSPLKNQGWERIFDVMKEFDCVATFDEKDAKEHNLLHFIDPYAKRDIKEADRECGVFFVGADKGRGQLLHNIAKRLEEESVDADIRVAGLDSNLEIGGLKKMTEYLKYDDVLKVVKGSDCLLEVLCEGQNSSSLRYYEAVVYNKKLLSNNPNIVNMPYYNPKFMRCFKSEEDIDFDWLKEKIEVDYQYKDDFSIKVFLNDVVELLD